MRSKIILGLFFGMLYSWAAVPMEPLRRTLTVFHHGINEDSNGSVRYDCHQWKGVGFNTFNQKGTFGYMVDSVLGSYHLAYNQSTSHPGMSPVHLKFDFGYRDYRDFVDSKFDFLSGGKTCPTLKAPFFWPKNDSGTYAINQSYEMPNYSMLENAAMRWIATEMHSYLGWVGFQQMRDDKTLLPKIPYAPYASPKDSVTQFSLGEDNGGDNEATDIDLFARYGNDGHAPYFRPIHDPRLYMWFKKNGLSTSDIKKTLPSDTVISWLKKLRAERPDLVPSRYMLLVHSMGGPTSREYIQGASYQGDVDKVITFDSPQLGSPIAKSAVEMRSKEAIQVESAIDFTKILAIGSFVNTPLLDPSNTYFGRFFHNSWEMMILEPYLRTIILGIASGEVPQYNAQEDAINYLSPEKDLFNLNNSGMNNKYSVPSHRIFWHEGFPVIGNPSASYAGQLGAAYFDFISVASNNPILSYINPELYRPLLQHLFYNDYTGTDWTYRLSNGVLAYYATRYAGIDMSQQGTMVVPAYSSKAHGVKIFDNADVLRKGYYLKSPFLRNLGLALIPAEQTVYAVDAALSATDWWTTGFGGNALRLIADAAAGAAVAYVSVAPVDKMNDEEDNKFTDRTKVGFVGPGSHDYSHSVSYWKHTSGNPNASDLEEFIYEKPFLSFASIKIGDSVVPKIFGDTVQFSTRRNGPVEVLQVEDLCADSVQFCMMADTNAKKSCGIEIKKCKDSTARKLWPSAFAKSSLREINFQSGDGWSGAMALKSEDYDPITCEKMDICKLRYGATTDSFPKVRRPHRYSFQNALLTQTPKEIHLVLDDVRPDLIQAASVDFNFSHRFNWTRNMPTGSCQLSYQGQWGDKTLLDSTDCPADAWGNWILRPDELAKKVDTIRKAVDLIRDGQNTVTFFVKNKVGLEHSQRVFFLKQAVPPRLDAIWPGPNMVLKNTRPVVKTMISTISYPDLKANPNARWCVKKKEGKCNWNNYSYQGMVHDVLGEKSDSNAVFADTAHLDATSVWETVVELGTQSSDGQTGKSFTLINTLRVDTTAPDLRLKATPDHATTYVNPLKDSAIAHFAWQDSSRIRFLWGEIYDQDGKQVTRLALQHFPAQQDQRVYWNGQSPVCGGACPSGKYTLKLKLIDEAVMDSAQEQKWIRLLDSLWELKKDSVIQNMLADTSVFNPRDWNLTQKEVDFHIRHHAPKMQIVALTEHRDDANQSYTRDRVLNSKERLRATIRIQDSSLRVGDSSTVQGFLNLSKIEGEVLKKSFSFTIKNQVQDTTIELENDQSLLSSGTWKINGTWSDLASNLDSNLNQDTLQMIVDRDAPTIQNLFFNADVFTLNPTNPKFDFELSDGQSCKSFTISPRKDTVQTLGLPILSPKPLVNLDPTKMDTSRQGQWLAVLSCTDPVGNESVAAASFLVGKRPSVIKTPLPLSELKHGLLAIKGMTYHPNPSVAYSSAGVKFALDWKLKSDTLWRNTGIQVNPTYHLPGDPISQGTGEIQQEQLLATWDLSQFTSTTVDNFELRLRTWACDENQKCDSAQVQVEYTDGGSLLDDSLTLAIQNLVDTLESGQGMKFKPRLRKSKASYFSPSYQVNLHATDKEGQVLFNETYMAPATALDGKPTAAFPSGLSLWTDSIGLNFNFSSMSTKIPVKYLKLNQSNTQSGASMDTLVDRRDSVSVGRVSLVFGSDSNVKCPKTLAQGLLCTDTLVTVINPQTQKLYAHAIRFVFNGKLSYQNIQIAGSFDGMFSGLIEGDSAELAKLRPAQGVYGNAIQIFNADQIYLGQFQKSAASVGYVASIPIEYSKDFVWNGFTNAGSAYPAKGIAKLRMTVTEGGNQSLAQILDTSWFIKANKPALTSIVKSSDQLYYKSSKDNTSLELGVIQFQFGLLNGPALVDADILDAHGAVVRTLVQSKLYRATQPSSGPLNSLSWNGMNQTGENAEEGLYKFRIRLRVNDSLVDSASVSFNVKLSQWILAQDDNTSGLHEALKIGFREDTLIDNNHFVQADGDYIIGAKAKAQVHKPDTLKYKIEYSGTQKIKDMPAERFTVGVQAQRDKLELDVITIVRAKGWGLLGSAPECGWSDESGNTSYLAVRKTKMTFSRGDDSYQKIKVGATNSQRRMVVDNHRNQIAGGVSALVLVYDPNHLPDNQYIKEIHMYEYDTDYNIGYERAQDFYESLQSSNSIRVLDFGNFDDNHGKDSIKPSRNPVNCTPDDKRLDKICKTEDWDSNHDLLWGLISPHPDAVAVNEGYTWGKADVACNSHDYGDYAWGAEFSIKVPQSYWEPGFGYDNLVNKTFRFDPYNTDLKAFKWRKDSIKLLTPYQSQEIVFNSANQSLINFSGPANAPGTQESVRLRFYGTEGNTDKYQKIEVSHKGESPLVDYTSQSQGVSSRILVPSLTDSLKLKVSLKVKESKLGTATLPLPASIADLSKDNTTICTDKILKAEESIQNLCYVRYPLAAGIHFSGTPLTQNFPAYSQIKMDADGYIMGNGYEKYATIASAEKYFIDSAVKLIPLTMDTSVILSNYLLGAASGQTALSQFPFKLTSNFNIKERKITLDSTVKDVAKIKVNGQNLTPNYVQLKENYDQALNFSRELSNYDLKDWDSATDTALSLNALSMEYPLLRYGGLGGTQFKNIFLRSSALFGMNRMDRTPKGNQIISASIMDAYVNGLNGNSLQFPLGDPIKSIVQKTGTSYEPNPLLVNLKLYDLQLYTLNGQKHPIFRANWRSGSGKDLNTDTLVVSETGGDKISVSRRPDGLPARYDEWVTVYANQVWDSSEVYFSNQGKVVPVFSTSAYSDSLLWKSADRLGASQIHIGGSPQKVLGYLNLSRLNGNTSFYLVKHGVGKSFYQQFNLMVGQRFKDQSANISSLYGDAVVHMPPKAYGDSMVSVTIRTVNPKDNQIAKSIGLPVVGPVVEVLPSYDFCKGQYPCSNKPTVRIHLLRSALNSGGNQKDPYSLNIYKLKKDSVSPLSNVTWLFYEKGHVCGDTVKSPKDPLPCPNWDELEMTGSTSSFSDFALLDTLSAPSKDYHFDISPKVSDSLRRFVRFTGGNLVNLFSDDDSLLTDTADATPAVQVPIQQLQRNGLEISGYIDLPQRNRSYIHAVPVNQTGEKLAHYPMVHRVEYTPQLVWNYTGMDTIWLGNFNGNLRIPYQSNSTGNLHLSMRSKNGTEIWNRNEVLQNSDTLILPAPIDVKGRDTLRLLLGANTITGQALQVLGPVVRVDTSRPQLSLNTQLSSNGFGAELRIQLKATDQQSGVQTKFLQIQLGGDILVQSLSNYADLDSVFTISRKTMESCMDCQLSVIAKVWDKGANQDSTSWSESHVYPLPKGLWAWYPMGEGFGDLALDLGPNKKHMRLKVASDAWSQKESLRFTFASDSGRTALWQNGFLGSDTSWAMDGWYKGIANSNTERDLWSWTNSMGLGWRMYRTGNDLVFAQGENHLRFTGAFEANGLWTHFGLSYESGRLSLWKNGMMSSSIGVSLSPFPQDGSFKIGGDQGVFAFMKDWRFYQKSLTSKEINSLYHYREDHAAQWQMVQAENGVFAGDVQKDLSCAVPSRKIVSAKTSGVLSVNLTVDKAGYYGLGVHSKGLYSSEVKVDGQSVGIIPPSTVWSKLWVQNAGQPIFLYLSPGIHKVDVDLQSGQYLDWLVLGNRTDVHLDQIRENIPAVDPVLVAPHLMDLHPNSQYANYRLMFRNQSNQSIQGYKIRYFFKESSPIKEALIWDTDFPATATTSQDDLGNEYVEVMVPGESVLMGGQNAPSRGLSLAVRPALNSGDWSLKWDSKDDPSWVSGAFDQFVSNPGLQILDLENNPLSSLFCPAESSPIQPPPQVQVIAMEGQLNERQSSNPAFTIENLGSTAVNSPILRYYFTVTEQSKINVDQWNQESGVVWDTLNKANGNWILEVRYPNILVPGAKTNPYSLGSYQIRVDWPNNYNKVDDWSNTGLTQQSKVTDYITVHDLTGKILWGKAPSWAVSNQNSDGEAYLSGSDLVLDLKTSGMIKVRLVSVDGIEVSQIFAGILQAGQQRWTLPQNLLAMKSVLKIVVELNGRVIVNHAL